MMSFKQWREQTTTGSLPVTEPFKKKTSKPKITYKQLVERIRNYKSDARKTTK